MLSHKPKPCKADLYLKELFSKEIFSPGFERVKKTFSPFVQKRTQFPLMKIVTVAGTNGKGEVCYTLSHLLGKNQKKFFLWTSPHLVSVKERFYSDYGHIASEVLHGLIKKNHEKHPELSFYELLFFCFCDWVFTQVDEAQEFYLILEVGLGGRLDAVNVFDADITSIVSIGRDHQKILGDSLKAIFYEKFGITRKGQTLVSGISQDFLKSILRKECKETGVKLIEVSEDDFIQSNRAIALEISQLLGNQKQSKESLQNIFLPGRREVISFCEREFIFIGAHNRDGLKSLFNLYQKSNTIIVDNCDYLLCSFSDRDESELLEMLRIVRANKCIASNLIFCSFDHPRSVAKDLFRDLVAKEFKDEIDKKRVNFIDDIYWFINEIPKDSKVLVMGSYYFIGSIQSSFLC